MVKKNTKTKKIVKKKIKKNNLSVKQWVIIVAAIATLIVFLPTTILLIVGMLPTLVSFIVDRKPGKNKTFTIGVMNFAGCFPYILDIWTKSNSIDVSLSLLSQPKSIVVMYAAAGIGYVIDFFTTFIVSSILIQRSELRLRKIEKEKESLIERWGKEVTGKSISEKM